METSTKILSIFAGAGVVGTGGALAGHLLKNTKVSDVLSEKGHTFLSFDNESDLATWKTIAKAYSNSKKNKLKNLEIKAIGDEDATESAKSLRQTCQKAINSSDYTNNDLLLSAGKWCVKPISIKDLAGKQRTVLDLDESQDNEKDKWDEKVDDYAKDGATNKITDVDLKTKLNDAEDRKKIKLGCKGLVDKQNYEEDFEEKYSQFQEWCTIE